MSSEVHGTAILRRSSDGAHETSRLANHLSTGVTPPEGCCMNSPTRVRSYRPLLWGLAIVGTLTDQLSKYVVFSWLCP
ncbi:MAG TPA: hypothetical protein VFA18_19710, partial [Gemmataceae bacterium]|nr:hypothetical protein [Gemmataceae bacterium]